MADETTNNTTTEWEKLTVAELLKQPLSERKFNTAFDEKEIAEFSLDGVTFKGYKAYSFFYEITLLKQPERTQSGVIDLSTHAYFLTPHLKIDYSLMPYPMFCKLRQMMTQKLTFNLTCFDTDNHTVVENVEVYFAPDSFPKFATMARRLSEPTAETVNSDNPIYEVNKYIEILGVRDYTIELIGTNRDVATNEVTYVLNKPSGISSIYDNYADSVIRNYPANSTIKMGARAFIDTGKKDALGNAVVELISSLVFFENPDDENSKKWEFVEWKDTNDYTYIDGNEYFIKGNKTYDACWKEVKKANNQ
jgi:hypothetical protein